MDGAPAQTVLSWKYLRAFVLINSLLYRPHIVRLCSPGAPAPRVPEMNGCGNDRTWLHL